MASWIYVFLHHPNPAVVADALHQPELGNSALNMPVLADLVALHPSEEIRALAGHAVWRLPDAGVCTVASVLRSQGAIPSGLPEDRAHAGLTLLCEIAPQERSELASEIRRE